jgi:hypothetical protein
MSSITDIVSIKRNSASGLDDLFGYSAQDVENESQVKVADESNVPYALDSFEKYLEDYGYGPDNYFSQDKLLLSPKEINTFLQLTEKYSDNQDYKLLGDFMSRLIQNSYDHGYNNFKFDIRNLPPFDDFLDFLKGKEDNRINIKVIGDISDSSVCDSKYLNLFVEGNVGETVGIRSVENIFVITKDVGGELMFESKDSKCFVGGNVGYDFGRNSSNLKAAIKGYAGRCLGIYARNLEVFIKEKLGLGCDSNSYGAKIYFVEQYPHRKSPSAKIITGPKAMEHEKYIEMMKEFDRQMKKLEEFES